MNIICGPVQTNPTAQPSSQPTGRPTKKALRKTAALTARFWDTSRLTNMTQLFRIQNPNSNKVWPIIWAILLQRCLVTLGYKQAMLQRYNHAGNGLWRGILHR